MSHSLNRRERRFQPEMLVRYASAEISHSLATLEASCDDDMPSPFIKLTVRIVNGLAGSSKTDVAYTSCSVRIVSTFGGGPTLSLMHQTYMLAVFVCPRLHDQRDLPYVNHEVAPRDRHQLHLEAT